MDTTPTRKVHVTVEIEVEVERTDDRDADLAEAKNQAIEYACELGTWVLVEHK